jgi:hypothetical protein
MTFLRNLLLLAAVSVLAGCGQVHSNVSTYSKLDPGFAGQTIGILAMEQANESSLEFEDYANRLAQRLTAAGFRVVPLVEGGGLPEYIAFLDYGIDSGRLVESRRLIPQYGVTGYSAGRTTGTLTTYGNQSTFSGTTTLTPTYGVTGYVPTTSVETHYGRYVAVDIWRPGAENEKSEKVFEGTLTSEGSCQNLGKVIDPLLDSMFEGFPQPQSGEVVKTASIDC